MRHAIFCTVSLLVFCTALAPASRADPEPSRDWAALLRGEVQVEEVQSPDGLAGLRASFTVPAVRERIWSALVDYEHFTELFPDVERLRVLEQSASGADVEFWVDAVLTKYHYVLRRRYESEGRRLSWTRLSGDLQRIEGSWEISDTPDPGRLLLVYESYVKVGGIVPTSLVRWGATRKAREMAERVRQWLQREPRP